MTPRPCPDFQALVAFRLGRLPDPELDALAEHLGQCPACQGRLQASAAADPLLELARDPSPAEAAPPGVLHLMEQLKGLSGSGPVAVREGAADEADETPWDLVAWQPPERLAGRYRLLGRLGAGGMGTVYEAFDEQLGRRAAVKFPKVRHTAAASARTRERFLREIAVATRVRHPHVCAVYDAGDDRGHPYLVMDYVAGRSLGAELAERGRYEDCREAGRLAAQVARALAAVHAQGIVHRDLKPANVLLDESGRAVLTDFGLALAAEALSRLTAEGFAVGTPAYMSPEQLTPDAPVDARSDIYSLGVLLYEMVTGRPPFHGPQYAHAWQERPTTAPPPTEFRPDLDAGLDRIIRQALAHRPQDRPQTAAELADALERWLTAKSDSE